MRTSTIIFSIFLGFILIQTSQANPQDDGICQGLALQGATDNGAYQAGAIWSLVNNGQPGEYNWDIVTGVGIGAINTAWISQFSKGDEQPMADELLNFWQTSKASDFYKSWLGGIVQGLLFEPALYDTSPGVEFMRARITKPPQRNVTVGATNCDDATFWTFDFYEDQLGMSDFLNLVFASNAKAAVFPMQQVNNINLIEGSIMKNLDVASIVAHCRKVTNNDDSKIFVDAVLVTTSEWKELDITGYNTIQMLFVTEAITDYRATMYDIQKAQWEYPNVNFRYLVEPSSPLPSAVKPYAFSKKQISKMIDQGKSDAQQSMSLGLGGSWARKMKQVSEHLYKTHGQGATLQDGPEHDQMMSHLKKAFAAERARMDAELLAAAAATSSEEVINVEL